MCGICGILILDQKKGKLQSQELNSALNKLIHRGPDDQGIWTNKNSTVLLGHRRLSIIDLSSGGRQPLSSPSGNVQITYNGEIYNYIELRKELEKQGVVFSTQSDTEVLVAAYEVWGESFLEKLRGMFALAIWDEPNQLLLLARDYHGKKPLYYYIKDGRIYFSSEIDSLHALNSKRNFSIDEESLSAFLTLGTIPENRTIYKDVFEVPPSGIIRVKNSEIKSSSFTPSVSEPKLFLDSNLSIEELLIESVKIRLRADVPVGVFLSGGIDSGLIAAIASKELDQKLRTFTVSFSDSEFNEAPLAKITSEHIGSSHHEINLSPKVSEDLITILANYGQPFSDPSAIPSYYVSKFASEHVKVALAGDGGDEIFCGYRRYIAAMHLDSLSRIIPSKLQATLSNILLRLLPAKLFSNNQYDNFLRMLRVVNSGKNSIGKTLSYDAFNSSELSALVDKNSPFNITTYDLNLLPENKSFLEQIQHYDKHIELPSVLLKKMDIASMANSLEVRSPLLDHVLWAKLEAIPSKQKFSSSQTKLLLRQIAEKYLPPSITNAPKRGFEIPLVEWLETDLAEMRDNLILSKSGLLSEIFQYSKLEELLKGKQKNILGKERWARLTWLLLSLSIWDHNRKETAQVKQNQVCNNS